MATTRRKLRDTHGDRKRCRGRMKILKTIRRDANGLVMLMMEFLPLPIAQHLLTPILKIPWQVFSKEISDSSPRFRIADQFR